MDFYLRQLSLPPMPIKLEWDKVTLGFYKHKFGGIFLVRRVIADKIEIDNGHKVVTVDYSFMKDLEFMSEPRETMCEECGSIFSGFHGEVCMVCGERSIVPLINRH